MKTSVLDEALKVALGKLFSRETSLFNKAVIIKFGRLFSVI